MIRASNSIIPGDRTIFDLIVSFDEAAMPASSKNSSARPSRTLCTPFSRRRPTTSGQVTLRMPKLKGMQRAAAIVERCMRRETGVEEAMIEMYLAGVSTRRIEDVSEILWGSSASAATLSNLDDRAFGAVEEWRGQAPDPLLPLRVR